MNKIKKAREEKNISVLELSRATGISERYLRFIEAGEKVPSLKTACTIADVLDMSLDELFWDK